MSGDRFLPISALVEVNDAWVEPHPFVLAGPGHWKPQLSRKVFHETLHYWQFVSCGYLVRLVEEDWQRLLAFKSTGKPVPVGPLKREYLSRSSRSGFSPQDLVECAARFWEVQTLGAPKLLELELSDPQREPSPALRAEYERLKAAGLAWHHLDETGQPVGYSDQSFDLAMRFAAGRYAEPYLRLRGISEPAVAAGLFPLCAHFALQSPDPSDFYMDLIERAAANLRIPRGMSIESVWRGLYVDVWKRALLLHVECYGCEFFVGRAVIHESSLFAHPAYRLAYEAQVLAEEHIARNSPDFLIGPADMPIALKSLWTVDYMFATCGTVESRNVALLHFLAPPVVRLGDGRTWPLGSHYASLAPTDAFPQGWTAILVEIEDELLAVDRDWTTMQRALLGL